ncbi:hypothetical protein VNO77_42050 [Canavalia gladiata]|uniref:Uncharacterized protein n=1 Tax=Canavalia gladiata TaxID=3824 RepID=A0AAN9JZZ3_CANGL
MVALGHVCNPLQELPRHHPLRVGEMSSRPVRSYRRRKMNLELDLNRDPPPEIVREDVEGPSQQPQVPTIDVDAIDDDVVESSPRAFAQAKINARRIRRRIIVDVDSEDQTRRDLPNQTIINLESSSSSMSENSRKSPEPPKELVFNCPICMAPLVEEMSTSYLKDLHPNRIEEKSGNGRNFIHCTLDNDLDNAGWMSCF